MWSKARCLAIFSLCLYTFDTGSDSFVGGDLIWKCHQKYGMSVFFLVLLPGFIWGWHQYFDRGSHEFKEILKAISCPFWFIPIGWWKLCLAVIHDADKEKLQEAKL